MKKRTKVILGVVIGVLFLYSAFMTLGVYVTSQDYNDLRAKYNDVLAEQKTTLDNKMNEIAESGKMIPLESFARVIDENAVVSISSDDSAIIRLNIGEKTIEAMVAEMQKYIFVLPSAMKSAGVKTCIICVVDKEGDVKFGYTFHPDGTSITFFSEKIN